MIRQPVTMFTEPDAPPPVEPITPDDKYLAGESLKSEMRGVIQDCKESRQPGAAKVNAPAKLRELADELDRELIAETRGE